MSIVGMLITLIILVVLLALSTIFSGLSIGLLSLSPFELKHKAEKGDTAADAVYAIRIRGTELLISLVFGSVIVNVIITVMLASLFSGGIFIGALFAILVSTVFIAIFSELLPLIYFKKNGLKYGAMFAPYINSYLNTLHPVSIRIATFIETYISGNLEKTFSDNELLHILEEHEFSDDSGIKADELAMIRNAMTFGDKLVEDVMTPETVITAIEAGETLSPAVLKDLYDSGHSRFPVYEDSLHNVVGILYIHDLIDTSKHSKTARSAMNKKVYYVNAKQKLDHVLHAFISTQHHMFIVINEFSTVVGLVTIEDIIEQIMGREIVDEFDKFDNMREVAALQAQKRHAKSNIIGHKKSIDT